MSVSKTGPAEPGGAIGLILLRHTVPDVAPGTCYGRLDLSPGPDFETEAGVVAGRLPRFTRILSSPLRRCRALAEHVGACSGLAVETDPRLVEMDFGTWEGLNWDAVPRDELDAWAGDFWHARPHGGESVAMLTDRVRAFLADHGAARDWLVVSHAGVMRATLHLLGRDAAWRHRFDFGGSLALPCSDLVVGGKKGPRNEIDDAAKRRG